MEEEFYVVNGEVYRILYLDEGVFLFWVQLHLSLLIRRIKSWEVGRSSEMEDERGEGEG